MSIFKSTFPEGIGSEKGQLKARQNALLSRTPDSVQYFGSRTAWIRMVSAVNVKESSKLAKDNILLGGALYNGNLRAGVGVDASNAYSLQTSGGTQHRLGIRPMPGITGIEVKSKGAYGSLREVVVNFQCWDIKQLEDLELLYMRPGYSVLVEWGWIPYLDNNGKISSLIELDTMVLNGTGTKESIWKAIQEKAEKNGNYDAIYGFVKNYSWSARQDGGYDCTTSIITMGEIFESLKVNYVNSNIDISTYNGGKGVFGILGSGYFDIETPINKSYQKSFLAGILNEMYEIYYNGGGGGGGSPTGTIIGDIGVNIVGGIIDLGGAILSAPGNILDWATGEDSKPPETKSITLGGIKCSFFSIGIIRKGEDERDDFTDNKDQVYIRLRDFIDIFNKYVTLKDKANKTSLVKLSLDDRDGKELLCLGNIHQLSTNPVVCFIKNNAYSSKGELFLGEGLVDDIVEKLEYNYFLNDDYKNKQLGVIGNIYVNLGFLYKLVTNDELSSQDKKEKREIGLYDYFKNIMTGINDSIGNVANFDIHIDPSDSVARIIDINYVDEKNREEVYKNLTEIDLYSLKSTVRSYKLESKIFPEQSATVAIGAQVKGGGGLAQGDNTLIDFNQNLKDRIIPAKTLDPIVNPPGKKEEVIQALLSNLATLLDYSSELQTEEGEFGIDWFAETFDTSQVSLYSGALRDIIGFYKSYVKDENNNRSIIPTGLTIEMDGIGGILIGNLFKVPLDLLPKGYKGEDGIGASKIGYVVTRIGHSIGSNNDWVTKIESQFIILDEPNGDFDFEKYISYFK